MVQQAQISDLFLQIDAQFQRYLRSQLFSADPYVRPHLSLPDIL